MRFIVERFTENTVICEDEEGFLKEFPRKALPEEMLEGDILEETDEGMRVEREETARRRALLREKLEELIG